MTKNDKIKQSDINIHKGHRNRLRKEMLACNFTPSNEHKLLEYLLTYCYAQKDVNPIAHNLINTFGGFKNVLEARYKDLLKVDGVGENTAIFLSSLLPVYNYYNQQKAITKRKLTTAREFYENFGKAFSNENKEKLLLITLTDKLEVKKCVFISSGSENEVSFEPLKIYDIAKEDNCTNIILMHNHPSGDPSPSPNDNNNTKNLIVELKPFKLQLRDHLIVGSNGYYSYNESGKLFEFEQSFKPKL